MEHTFTVFLFNLVVLLFSVMVHEISHGVVAERLGDPTARQMGRLTLNPLKHLEPIGSIAVPLLLYVSTGGSVLFGWAKPVPYDPRNLKRPLTDSAKIAAAGPLSNFILAGIFALLARVVSAGVFGPGALPLLNLFVLIVYVNVLLGVFNIVPIPPLDGSKALFAFLPQTPTGYRIALLLEQYGFLFLIIFIFYGFGLIAPIVSFIVSLLLGS